MKNSSKKLLALVVLIIAVTSLTLIKAERKTEKAEPFMNSKGKKSTEPILLEKIQSGYKFYSPCINYSGQLVKNEGC